MDRYREEDERPQRSHPGARRRADEPPARRDSLMQRRLRAVRGEEVEEEYEDDDDLYDDRPLYDHPRDDYGPRYSGPGGCAGAVLYLVLGFLAVFLIILLVGRQFINNLVPSVSNVQDRIRLVVATPTTTVVDRGGTILQIRNLSRLETKSFSAERVIDVRAERGNILDTVTGDRLLLIARGTTVAGVDLSRLQDSDVDISSDGKQITLRLPPSEVFSSHLDTQNTRVYDRQRGILAPQNIDLETQARQKADTEIFNAACEAGITQQAADEAKRSMEQFLKLLDFETVQVIAPAGPCTMPQTVQTVPTATP